MSEKYLFGIMLSAQEAEFVNEFAKKYHEKTKLRMTLPDLVSGWSKFIEEIANGYEFGIFDYLNDLEGRRIIESALSSSPPRIKAKLSEVLEPIDVRFFDLTEMPSKKITDYVPGFAHDRWFRIPKSISGEFLQYFE